MREFSIIGGEIVTAGQGGFFDLYVKNGRLTILEDRRPASAKPGIKCLDVSNCFVTPGLIDLQVNGTAACNFWTEWREDEFEALCDELLHAGVTSFLPTLITADIEHIKKNCRLLEGLGAGRDLSAGPQASTTGATITKRSMIRMPGIHLEGPFISLDRPGVHPTEWIESLNIAGLEKLISPAVKLITLAPEYDQGETAVKYLLDHGIIVSLGHSNATFEQAEKAFDWGIKLVTHTCNALPPLHHRAVGAVGAALLRDDVACCLIADGLHVSEQMIKIILRLKGPERVVLVTDVAHVGTTGGGLVGSSIMLSDAVRNLVTWKAASFPEAIQMATINPAKAIGVDSAIGFIADNALANLVVWEKEDLKIRHVVASGNLVF